MAKFTSKDAKIRLYDGTATPYYLEIDLDVGDLSGPLGNPKTEENLILDRGNMTANAHYIEGSDEPMMADIPITFSAMLADDTQVVYILDWLAAMADGDGASPVQSSSTVNSNTLTSTKEDTQRDGANNNPAFADGTKMTSNIEILFTSPTGGTNRGFKYAEVYFPMNEQTISEAEDGVTLSLNGKMYGTVTRITSFTAGTSVEA